MEIVVAVFLVCSGALAGSISTLAVLLLLANSRMARRLNDGAIHTMPRARTRVTGSYKI